MRFCDWWSCCGMPGLPQAFRSATQPHGITHPSACPWPCTCRCICASEPRKFDASKAAMLANLSELAVRQAEHRWALDEHRKHNVGLMRQLSCYEQPFLFVDISEPGESPWEWCTGFPSHLVAKWLAPTPGNAMCTSSGSKQGTHAGMAAQSFLQSSPGVQGAAGTAMWLPCVQLAPTMPVHSLMLADLVMSSYWSLRAPHSADFWQSMCCGPLRPRCLHQHSALFGAGCTA